MLCMIVLAGLMSVPHVALAAAAHSPAITAFAQQDTVKRKPANPANEDKKAAKKKKKEEDSVATAADPAKQAAEDSVRRVKRAEKAALLPLFASREQLAFTLIANFNRLSKERDTLTKHSYAATLVVLDSANAERRIPVQLRTRGHFRLSQRNCRFVPIRVDFPDSGLKGTPFHGQESLKLGTHCQSEWRYEQYTMKEYIAYRMLNTLTDRSYRARLAKATYVDSATGKTVEVRTALWLESDDDVARRLGGHGRELRRALFDDVDNETLMTTSLFQYLIGNTDWSIYALHNIRMVQTDDGRLFPVPYDFDFSGLVNTSYATPDPKLPIKSVRDRLYRGPCRSVDELQPYATRILERRDAILALLKEAPGLESGTSRDVQEYLEEAFRTLSDKRGIKGDIVDLCVKKPGM